MIKNADIKCVLNEGMPQYKDPFVKGRLIVKFSVDFPEDNWINDDKLNMLEKLLPARQDVMIPDQAEECVLQKVEAHDGPGKSRGHGHEAYMEDDDDDQQGQRVQCASH